jgi:hypothetical protein
MLMIMHNTIFASRTAKSNAWVFNADLSIGVFLVYVHCASTAVFLCVYILARAS